MDNLRNLLLPFFSFSMRIQGRKGNRYYQESSDMNIMITSLRFCWPASGGGTGNNHVQDWNDNAFILRSV